MEQDFFDDYVDSFLGLGKKAQRQRELRQKAKQDRKDKRITLRDERKKLKNAAIQKRKYDRMVLKNASGNVEQQYNAPESNTPNLDNINDLQASLPPDFTPQNITPVQLAKAQKYIEKVGGKVESNSPDIVSAQFLEARGVAVNRERNRYIQDAEDDAMYIGQMEEPEIPPYEDFHEDILEQESEAAAADGFDTESVDYLDPETVAALVKAGQQGIGAYRDARFAKGKKAFGMTQEQYEAKLAGAAEERALLAGVKTAANSAADEIETVKKKSFLKEKAPLIILGIILLIAAGTQIKNFNFKLK